MDYREKKPAKILAERMAHVNEVETILEEAYDDKYGSISVANLERLEILHESLLEGADLSLKDREFVVRMRSKLRNT